MLDTPWVWGWIAAAAALGFLLGRSLGRRGRTDLAGDVTDHESQMGGEGRRPVDPAATQAGEESIRLQADLDEARMLLGESEGEVDRLRAGLESAERRTAEMETATAAAQRQFETEAEVLRAAVAELRRERDTLLAAGDSAGSAAEARLAALRSELGAAERRAGDLEQALGASARRCEELGAELEQAQSRAAEAEAAAQADAARAAEGHRVRLEALQGEMLSLRTELDAEMERTARQSGELTARDHLIRELQVRVDGLAGVESRLTAREAEYASARRHHDTAQAAKDIEIRKLRNQLDDIERVRRAGAEAERELAAVTAELEATRDELAVMEERSRHSEREAVRLRAESTPRIEVVAEPTPAAEELARARARIAELEAAASDRIRDEDAAAEASERLSQLSRLLADRDSRIAYLVGRIARLEGWDAAVEATGPDGLTGI